MALNPVAKRIYNVAPDPVAITFADDATHSFEMRSAEFFQDDLQAEATRPDDPGAEYRMTTDGDRVLVGRKGPDDDGWTVFGEAVAAEPA